ncbi:hypothetical protein B0I33_101264 [Prauserella shujinwangii]|uniref:Uncharacterized protein n=1 Tax=Prauserella shujinwangii TaxID=1453103 RepID=A0A2T0M2X6_9PSEU|nr:hypothetical protein [Prauserella shujinwangii]PRX51111.1 hypothetical protein B0I33_101264 [Prauserella shujinwangii]
MTAPLRLPDAFTPGATRAAAATPTCSCCCCCCCCAVSTVGATVALPAGFAKDVRAEREGNPPGARARLAAVLLGALPALTIVVGYLLGRDLEPMTVLQLALPIAAGTALVFAALGGSRRPWHSAGRVVLWAAAFIAEFLVLLPVFLTGLHLVLGIAYLAALVLVPRCLLRAYRRRP